MEIDKILYNIELKEDIFQIESYVKQLDKSSLEQVLKELIERVNHCNPDEQDTIDQIRRALTVHEHLQRNETFRNMKIQDEQFILNLGFYIQCQKESSKLILILNLIESQYFSLNLTVYSKSINLFKHLLLVYSHIGEQYYERLTLLMLSMVIQNSQLVQYAQKQYNFLQCLLQMLNRQQDPNKLKKLLNSINKLYQKKNIHFFHEKDLKVLVDIVIRIFKNQQQNELLQNTLDLHFTLSQCQQISKQKYRQDQFKEILKEKLTHIKNQEETENEILRNKIEEIL